MKVKENEKLWGKPSFFARFKVNLDEKLVIAEKQFSRNRKKLDYWWERQSRENRDVNFVLRWIEIIIRRRRIKHKQKSIANSAGSLFIRRHAKISIEIEALASEASIDKPKQKIIWKSSETHEVGFVQFFIFTLSRWIVFASYFC